MASAGSVDPGMEHLPEYDLSGLSHALDRGKHSFGWSWHITGDCARHRLNIRLRAGPVATYPGE